MWTEVKCIGKLSLWEIFWIPNSLQRKFTYHSFIFFCRYVLLPRWLSVAGLLLSRRATRQFSIEKCWIRTRQIWRSHCLLWWKTSHYSLPSTTKRCKQKWKSLKWLLGSILKSCQNKMGRKFVWATPKIMSFSQLPAVKKTPFLVQLKQIFGPSFFVTVLKLMYLNRFWTSMRIVLVLVLTFASIFIA